MANAIATTGINVDISPVPIPAIITVPGPVEPLLAISLVGL